MRADLNVDQFHILLESLQLFFFNCSWILFAVFLNSGVSFVQLDFWIMYLLISNPGLMLADHVKFINVNWLLFALNYLNSALPPL